MDIIPPGYVGTIRAMQRIAKAAYPARWTREAVPAAEAKIWESLGKTLSGCLWEEHLMVLVRPRTDGLIERFCDYREAIVFLRQAMVSESLRASVIDALGNHVEIPADIWAISGDDELDDEFLNGAVWLPEQGVQALCERATRDGIAANDSIFDESEAETADASPASQSGDEKIRALRKPRGASVLPLMVRALFDIYPDDEPPPNRLTMLKKVQEKIGPIGSEKTLDRARKIRWPKE